MSRSVTQRLILKDIYLHRHALFGLAVALPAAGVAATLFGGETMWRHMGLIILNNSLLYLIFFLPMATVLGERHKQTLAFVMSQPVSYREYTASKLLGCSLAFAVTWVGIAAALPLIVERSEKLAAGTLPLLALILGVFALFFLLTLSVALVSESYLWTLAVGLGSVAFVFLFFPLLASLPRRLLEHWMGDRVIWDPEVLIALGVQLLLAIAMVAGTFALQRRKTDFL